MTALAKMRLLNGHCNELANIAEDVINHGNLHVYPKSAMPLTGGFAPDLMAYTPNAYIAVSDEWVDLGFDEFHTRRDTKTHYMVDLQLILAHEADHLWGVIGHTTGQGPLYTTYTRQCSGLGSQ